MFEKASKEKVRFATEAGNITTEDLWDLPLTSKAGVSLDGMAKSLNKAVKESGKESFVFKKSRANDILELKFDIVKKVIEVRLKDIDKKEKAEATKAQKEKIYDIIENKEDDALAKKSVAQLKKMVEKL